MARAVNRNQKFPFAQFTPASPVPRFDPFEHDDYLFDLKMDEFRALAHVGELQTRLVSCRGNVYKSFPNKRALLVFSTCLAAVPVPGNYSVPAWSWLEGSNAQTLESCCDSAAPSFCFVYSGDLCFERRITQYLKMPCGVMEVCQDEPMVTDSC